MIKIGENLVMYVLVRGVTWFNMVWIHADPADIVNKIYNPLKRDPSLHVERWTYLRGENGDKLIKKECLKEEVNKK